MAKAKKAKSPKGGDALTKIAVAKGDNDFGPRFLDRLEREEGTEVAEFVAGLREGIDY